MNEEDCTFARFIYPRLLAAAEKQGIDPGIFQLIFELRHHTDMQKLLDDICRSVVMTIEQHQKVRNTFEKINDAVSQSLEGKLMYLPEIPNATPANSG